MKTNNKIIIITLGFIFSHSILAQSWVQQTSGTTNALRSVFFTDNLKGWVVGNAGIVRNTTNKGILWQTVTGLGNQDLLDVAFLDANTGIIVGDNGRIYRTVNGGLTWSQVASGTTSNLQTVTFGSGGLVHAAGRDGVILRSADNGASWSVILTGSIRYRGSSANGNSSWIVGENGTIQFSNNGGVSYLVQTSGTASNLHTIQMLSSTVGFIGGQNSTMLYTNNGGVNWVSRNSGIAQGVNGISFVNSQTGWAVCNIGGIYRTVNSGVSWGSENSGTTAELNDVFFFDVNHGWAVGAAGVILFRGDNIGVTQISGNVPSEFSLRQNYPNPFNPVTQIEFSVPSGGNVSLKIYDMLGNEIETLVNEYLNSGIYKTDFNASGYPSGTYFYKLEAENFSQTKKMILIK